MAVFLRTNRGDIYAGPTREACVAAIIEDGVDDPVNGLVEVSGKLKMRRVDEHCLRTKELITLEEEYGKARCISDEAFGPTDEIPDSD